MLCKTAFANASLNFQWSANTEADILAYRIYSGPLSGIYTAAMDVLGGSTTATVLDLIEGETYYFALTAINTAGLESPYSAELVYTVPYSAASLPTMNPLSTLVLSQNAGMQTVDLSGISAGVVTGLQTMTITATSSNPALIPAPTVHYTSPSTAGDIAFTPVANAWGNSLITVTLNNGQPSNNIVTRSFFVYVNNTPTIDPIPSLSITRDAPTQTITLTGISAGPANEAQPIQVTAASSSPGLISPALSYSSPNSTASLSFTPAPGLSGLATISVSVNDGQGGNNTITRFFVVTVSAVNQAPTLDPISSVVLAENAGAVTITATGITSGSSSEQQPLTVTTDSSNPALVSAPLVHYASPGTNASISFKPNSNVWGNAVIVVTVNDGQPTNNIVSRSFNVFVNNPPTLDPIPDFSINQDAPLQNISLTGITSGSTLEAQPLQVTATSSAPSLITPTISYSSPNSTGVLSFKPAAGASGTALVTVTVNDGQSANNAFSRTFSVTVNAVNKPPTLDPLPSTIVMLENATQVNIPLTGITSGSSTEIQTLTVSANSSNPTLIPPPTVTYISPNTSGTISLKPGPNAWGSATVTVSVSDGQPSNSLITRFFNVLVNNPPTVDPISNVVLNQDAPTQTINITGITSGSSVEAQTLQLTATSSNPGLISPSISYSSPNSTATLSFKPAAGASGSAVVTLTVNDGQAANNSFTRSFTVTVNPVNLAPTLDPLPTSVTLQQNASALNLPLTGISSGSSTESQTLTVTTTSSNPTLLPAPVVTYTSPNTTGSLSVKPSANLSGTALVTVTVNDGQTSNNVISRSFTVLVNNPPTLDPVPNVSVNQDASSQTIALTGISSGAATELQTIQITASSSAPSLISPAISYTSPNSIGSLTFKPAPGASGSAVITIVVNDGQTANNTLSRSFTVTVNPLNQPPTLDPLPASVAMLENANALTLPLTGISSGASTEIQTLTITATSSNPLLLPVPTITYTSPNSSGSLVMKPTSNAWGTATITVTVNDGQPSNNIVSRSFSVLVNNPPTVDPISNVIINQDAATQTVNLTGIASGASVEAQTLQVTATSSLPSLISPSVSYTTPGTTGVLTFKPTAGASGTAVITVTVNDGQTANNTSSRTFSVTVNQLNLAPTLDPLPTSVTLAENASALTIPLTGITSGSSGEAQTLTVTATSSNPALLPVPAITYTSPNSSGSLVMKPTSNAWGTATITVTVNDGQPSNNIVSRSFSVLVNNPPTVDPISNVIINQDAPTQTVNLTGISSGASVEAQTLQITATSSLPSLIAPSVSYTSPGSTGVLTFKPTAGASGTAVITVTVNDGQPANNTSSRTFSVTVNPLNVAPTLDPLPASVTLAENASALTIPLTGITSGSSSEAQTLTVTTTSSNPALLPIPAITYTSPNSSGSLVMKPTSNAWGTATVTVTVNDGQPSNNIISRSFSVLVNNAPTLDPVANVVINQDAPTQTLNLTGISSGSSVEAQTLQVTAISSAPGLITPSINYASANTTGVLTFKPAPGGSGTAVITVTVNDGQSGNATFSRSLTVTVNPVNQTPTLGTLPASFVLAENAGAVTVPLTGISSGASTEVQTLSVTASSSNPLLIPTPVVTYVSPNSSGSLVFKPTSNSWGSATITVTVNDGQPSNNIVSRSFSVLVNNPPTVDPVANVVIAQDAPIQTINLSGITSGASSENQNLQLTAVSSAPGLISPAISYTSPNSNGTLTFKPAAGASGTATITLTVNDSQGANNTFSRSFTVTIYPVNQAPTLDPLPPSIVVTENASATVPLTGITSGASTELQPLSITASSSNPALVAAPVISYTSPNTSGSLSLKPLSNTWGTATITVTVNDGQPSNNIVSRSFTVYVNNPPTVDPVSNLVMAQNASAVAVTLTGITSGSTNESQVLTVTTASSNPGLITAPAMHYASPSSSAGFAFKPASNTWGSATITVTVNDGQAANNTVTRSFTVLVNNPPTLDPIPNVSITGASTIALTGISSGATNEAQTLLISAVSSNPAILPNPVATYASPNASGSLVLSPVSGATGTATVTVTVSDGQSANNLITRSFVVTIGTQTLKTQTVNGGFFALGGPSEPTATDRSAPTVSNLELTGRDARRLAFSWQTDVPVSCSLEYGTTTTNLDLASGYTDAGTSHSMILTNLAPATDYYIRVRTVDANQLSSTSDIASSRTGDLITVRWSAEDGTLTPPMFTAPDDLAENGQFIATGRPNAGAATYEVQIPQDSVYRLWFRAKPVAAGGSFLVSLDGGPEARAAFPARGSLEWRWWPFTVSGTEYQLTVDQGTHVLLLQGGTADTFLDELCLSNDPDWTPTGLDF